MLSHRATPFLLALPVLLSPLLTSSGRLHTPQGQSLQPQSDPTANPPGVIGGAQNPELIPDQVAYRMVFLAAAEPQDASDAEKARFRAKIGPAALSDEDTEAFRLILGTLKGQLDALNAQANQVLARDPLPPSGSPDYQQLAGLAAQRQPFFDQAMSALPARLSPEGWANLQAFVQNEKRRMKYLPENP
jgi:hypothetical protein